MPIIRSIKDLNDISNTTILYISLDTYEGALCVGHWIWECALFLPHIKEIQKEMPNQIKILL